MTNRPAPEAAVCDASGVVQVDHACHKCQYNLRSLHVDGRCPECGTPLALSLQGDLIRFSDPAWIRTVARGLTIILWMIAVSILIEFVGGIIRRATGPAVPLVLSFGAALASFYGVWLMTEPDPGGIGEDRDFTARRVVRIALVAGLAGQFLSIIEEATTPPAPIGTLLLILGAVLGLVAIAGEFAKFVFYEKLSRRIPDHELASRFRFLKWAWVAAFGIIAVGGLFVVAVTAARTTAGGQAGGVFGAFACLAIPVLLAMVIFGIVTLVSLLQLRGELRKQAAQAEQIWAAGGPGMDNEALN